MKLNMLGVVAILAGVTLLYAAVKNIKPQDVIRQALGKQAIGGAIAPAVNDTLPPASGVPVVTT